MGFQEYFQRAITSVRKIGQRGTSQETPVAAAPVTEIKPVAAPEKKLPVKNHRVRAKEREQAARATEVTTSIPKDLGADAMHALTKNILKELQDLARYVPEKDIILIDGHQSEYNALFVNNIDSWKRSEAIAHDTERQIQQLKEQIEVLTATQEHIRKPGDTAEEQDDIHSILALAEKHDIVLEPGSEQTPSLEQQLDILKELEFMQTLKKRPDLKTKVLLVKTEARLKENKALQTSLQSTRAQLEADVQRLDKKLVNIHSNIAANQSFVYDVADELTRFRDRLKKNYDKKAA